jgi:hypothetical protein
MQFRHTSKEDLLEFWQDAERKAGLKIHYRERVESIKKLADGRFAVQTQKQTYRASSVLLAIGRRGTPRKLGVPGEDLPKVVYRLLDREQYQGQSVLVVGGGDSALEAAASIAELPFVKVWLSYRGEAFDRGESDESPACCRGRQGGTIDSTARQQGAADNSGIRGPRIARQVRCSAERRRHRQRRRHTADGFLKERRHRRRHQVRYRLSEAVCYRRL